MPLLIKNTSKASAELNGPQIKDSVKNHARVFFALWPEPSLQEQLHQIALTVGTGCRGRVMRCDTLHLTLLFLGSIERRRLPVLINAAAKVAASSFMLEINRFSCWRHNRISYVAPRVAPPELEALVHKLKHEVSAEHFSFDHREFKPHMTLLRNIGSTIDSLDIEPVYWRANSFVLLESAQGEHGAHYRVLHTWPLASAEASGSLSCPLPV